MELAPPAVIGGERKARDGLDLTLFRDPHRSRQRFADIASIDGRPDPTGVNHGPARIGRNRYEHGNEDQHSLRQRPSRASHEPTA
jgi:hypothetical protein